MNPYLVAVLGIIFTLVIGIVFRRYFKRYITKASKILGSNPTNYKFFGHLLTAAIYIIGFSWSLYQIPEFKTISTSLLTGAGIAAAAIGFASQHALSNVISGLFIIVFKPFKIHDQVVINNGEIRGEIEDITLRHTVIRNYENQRVVIPNSILNDSTILNADFIDEKVCKWVEFDISYDADIDKAKSIIKEIAAEHPSFIDPRTPLEIQNGREKIPIYVVELGSSYVRLRAWIWATDQVKALYMRWDLLESVKKAFDREGIEIPYPYTNVVMKNPEQES